LLRLTFKPGELRMVRHTQRGDVGVPRGRPRSTRLREILEGTLLINREPIDPVDAASTDPTNGTGDIDSAREASRASREFG